MIPLSYNLRNLLQRKGTTLMTAFGIALTVAVLVTSLALRSGLDRVFSGTGHPLQFLVLRKGSTAELNSSVSVEAYNLIKELPGIARTPDGTDLISRESITIVNLASREYPDGMNITVRGVSEMGPRLREFSIARGRMFNPGQREVIVGSGVARRYPDAAIGSTIRFGRGLWTVVGVFSTNGSAADSEIWCDLNQLAGDFSSQGSSSILLARAENTAAMESLKKLIEGERRAGADVIFERKYYAEQQSSGQLLQTLGGFVAVVMAVGSAFAATNTMYAAVSRRKREIGTLRALGFTRADILRSFVLESVFLSLLGGILGVLIALPVNNASAGVGSFSTFSEISFQFRIDAPAILTALLFSALIGALGGFLPAWSASKMNIIQAMRDA
jgi:ABC-type lipoprotein release transport system permease subunit